MRKKTLSFLSVLLIVFLITSACSLSSITEGITKSGPQPGVAQATQDLLAAQAAEQTATQIQVEIQKAVDETQAAAPQAGEIASATPEPATPTETLPPPTETPIPPTETLAPTQTPLIKVPTKTQTPLVVLNPAPPSGSPTPVPCNGARFVADVTVKDGTVFAANTGFTKTWRLRNTGSCTWSSSYDIVFMDGYRMGAPTAIDMPSSVAPGQEVDITIGMVAPSSVGTYRGNWKIRSDTGATFGVGGSSASFYVEIYVNTTATIVPPDYVYDFTGNFCSASWTSGFGNLSCPGTDGDSKGFVLRIDRPQLETGQIDDEPGLITQPQAVNNGIIRGKYPSIRVQAGYHFMALIGCEYTAKNCSVKFQLDYQIGDGAIQNLASWTEGFDGNFQVVDVDVSGLAGQDVKFILTVLANGEMNQDRALWLAPRIDTK